MRRIPVSLTLFLLASGCDSGPPPSNVPAADRARAVKVTDPSQLIGGPKASGRIGDILLANTRVRFIIEGGARSRAWFPTGGTLLDADRVRPDGKPGSGEDRLQEMVTRLGSLGVLHADKIEIAGDGSDGNAAIVRVTGHDMPVPILQSVAPTRRANVRAVTEYRLLPYADSLEITTTVTDASGADQSVPAGDLFVLGDFVTLFAPGIGSDKSQLSFATGVRYFAAFGGPVSYGYVAPRRKLTLLVPQAEIFGAGTDSLHLPANGSVTFTRHLVVGDGDVVGLLPEIVRREGGDPKALVPTSGTVAEASTKAPIAGAQIVVADAKGPYTLATTDGSGHFQAPLEHGSYTFTTSVPGRPGTAEGSLDASSSPPAPLVITLADTGQFTLAITDDLNHPSPARVQLRGKDGTGWGFVLSPDGFGKGTLPPGNYVAVGSRGYEWEAAEVPFTVEAGKVAKVSISLAHVVDTSGFIAIDSHTHTAISVDSQLDPVVRVAQALGDGVELVITTDHDVLFDIAPTASGMSLAAPLATTVGCEVSPVPGHINAYPAAPGADADTDGYWAVKWWSEDPDHIFMQDLWPKDIFGAIRSKLGSAVVQLNHPRSGQGVLNWVGYDASRGLPVMDPTRFDMGWDVIEVCNAGCDQSPDSEDGKSLRDWYSFLNQGYVRGAVGVSDAHGDSSLLGRARTLVEVRDDDPAHLVLDEVWSSLKAGRATVQDGAFVVASIQDDGGKQVGMGGLAKATGGKVTIHARVQAPSWIPSDTIHVIRNGIEIQVVPIAQTMPPKVVRFDGDIVVDGTPGDAWYVLIVDGAGSMAPVLSARPRSITNPVFVDRNGNGRFDAPGL